MEALRTKLSAFATRMRAMERTVRFEMGQPRVADTVNYRPDLTDLKLALSRGE